MGQCIANNFNFNEFSENDFHHDVSLTDPINNIEPNIIEPNIIEPNIIAPNINAPNNNAPNNNAPNIITPNINAPNINAPNNNYPIYNNHYDYQYNDYRYNNYIRPKECIRTCADINEFYDKIIDKTTTSTRTKKMILQYKPMIEKLEIEHKKLLEDRKNFTKIEIAYQKLREMRFNCKKVLNKQVSLTNRLQYKKAKLHYRVTTATNIENMKLFNIDCEQEKYLNMRNIPDINMDRLHNRFPDEILDIIGSYLPYSTRILMIEKFHNPLLYLNRLGAKPIRSMVDYISDNIHFTGISPFFYIPLVHQYDMLSIMNTRDEGIVLIKTLINIFKKKRPKIAFNLLRMFAILNKIGAGKKYYQYIDFNLKIT
jgi:hypothetical protein